jgi:hypothetical protein
VRSVGIHNILCTCDVVCCVAKANNPVLIHSIALEKDAL